MDVEGTEAMGGGGGNFKYAKITRHSADAKEVAAARADGNDASAAQKQVKQPQSLNQAEGEAEPHADSQAPAPVVKEQQPAA